MHQCSGCNGEYIPDEFIESAGVCVFCADKPGWYREWLESPEGKTAMAGIISSDDVNAMFDAMKSVSPEQKRYQREMYAQQTEKEPDVHYHVVAFMDGCLNDYDTGPIETIEEVRNDAIAEPFCVECGDEADDTMFYHTQYGMQLHARCLANLVVTDCAVKTGKREYLVATGMPQDGTYTR